MPKIIENLEARLMEEAKKQIEEGGYDAFTIRSVAKACGIGVGTVYNYFPSKDSLLAAYLLTDWNNCLSVISEASLCSDSPEPVIDCMYHQLQLFSARHHSIFQNASAIKVFQSSFAHYHGTLRSQLSEPVKKFCTSDFSAEFIAEAMLTWTMAGKSFDKLYGILKNCF